MLFSTIVWEGSGNQAKEFFPVLRKLGGELDTFSLARQGRRVHDDSEGV